MTGERQAQARFNRGTLTFWRFRPDWADRLETVRRTRTPRQPSDCQEIDLPYWLGRDRVRARAEPIGVWAMKSSFSSWIRIFSVGAAVALLLVAAPSGSDRAVAGEGHHG